MMIIALIAIANFFYTYEVCSDTITNGNFETTTGWTYSTNNTSWSAGYDTSVFHGGSKSYRISWPSNGIGTVGDYADIKQTITVPSASRFYEIDLWLKDDYTSGCLRRNFPYKQILIDGVVVWEDSVQGNETSNGWMHVLQDVTEQLMGKTQATITLRVYHKQLSASNGSINFGMMQDANISCGRIYSGAMWSDNSYDWAFYKDATSGWTYENGSVKIPSQVDKARIWIHSTGVTGNIWVDDITADFLFDNPNPYFEDGTGSLPDNWLMDGYLGATTVVTWSGSNYYSGTKAVKMEGGNYAYGGICSNWKSVTPGTKLELSMMLETDLTTGGVYLGAQWGDGTYSWAVTNSNSPSTWTKKKGVVQVPAGVTKARVWVYPYYMTGSIWVDDVVMQRYINSGFEDGTGTLPSEWIRDTYGAANVSGATDNYYSGQKSLKISSTVSEDTGGAWTDWVDIPADLTDPLLTVNVWFDDVALNTDGLTTLESRRANVGYCLGDYSGAIHSGHLETEMMIDRLVDANITDYNYLIISPYDWEDLPDFLDAAYTAGIRVWVAIIPPHEQNTFPSLPYGLNFLPDDEDSETSDENDHDGDNTDNWITQVGQLSLTHPALVGLYIDDFIGGGLDYHNSVMKMSTVLHRINPNIAFIPVVYHDCKDGLTEFPMYWVTKNNDLSSKSGWVEDAYLSGRHSLKISKASPAAASWVGEKINFNSPYPTTLTFGGWAKAENAVAGSSPLFCIDFKVGFTDDTYQWYYNNTQFSYGTHNWQNKQTTITFSKNVKSVTPYCLFYNSTGTVWFDDIYVKYNGENKAIDGEAEHGSDLKPYIDGIIFPYRNTTPTSLVELSNELSQQIGDMRLALGDNKSLITMIYAVAPSWGGNITPDYIETALSTAHYSTDNDGVQTYSLPKLDQTNLIYQEVASLYSQWSYPMGWLTYSNDLDEKTGWVKDVYYSGIHSLKISKASPGAASWIGEKINFSYPYPTTLTFGGWAKAENAVAGSSPLFCLDFRVEFTDDTYQWYYGDTLFSYGTHDWENKEATKTFGKSIKSVTPYCLFYNSTGTVWFDDIYVNLSGTNQLSNPGAEISD
jgi:hypothetical protein